MKENAKVEEILKRTTRFYADLKRICETTNWEAGSYVQNQKLILSKIGKQEVVCEMKN